MPQPSWFAEYRKSKKEYFILSDEHTPHYYYVAYKMWIEFDSKTVHVPCRKWEQAAAKKKKPKAQWFLYTIHKIIGDAGNTHI